MVGLHICESESAEFDGESVHVSRSAKPDLLSSAVEQAVLIRTLAAATCQIRGGRDRDGPT